MDGNLYMGPNRCSVCGSSLEKDPQIKELPATLQPYPSCKMKLCSRHRAFHEAGFIALIEVTNHEEGSNKLHQKDAKRTGTQCHLRRSVAHALFPHVYIDPHFPLIFVRKGLVAELRSQVRSYDLFCCKEGVVDDTETDEGTVSTNLG